MRDVIQKVIATEAEAKRILEAAKAGADRISSDAQKQAHELVARARQKARTEAEEIVAVAVHEAEQEKHERLVRAAAEIETQVRLEETTKQRAVEAAIRCVCEPRQPREELPCHA